MIITVTLNPAIDKTVYIPDFAIDQVNRVERVQLDPGGKGINVSKSVQAMGGQTLCIAVVGGDTGSYIIQSLSQMGLQSEFVHSSNPTRTNTKIVDLKRGTNTDINEAGAAVTEDILDALWQKLSTAAKPGDTVVFAGKNPPGTPPDLLARWTRRLRSAGVRVCIDTVGEPMLLALKEKPHVIKPNIDELSELIGRQLESTQQIIDAAREILAMGVELIAVSMGADGAIFITADEAVRAYSSGVSVVSTVGAGDSVMAGIAYCLENGLDLEKTAHWATAVATATVQIPGSMPAQREQIAEAAKSVKTESVQFR